MAGSMVHQMAVLLAVSRVAGLADLSAALRVGEWVERKVGVRVVTLVVMLAV